MSDSTYYSRMVDEVKIDNKPERKQLVWLKVDIKTPPFTAAGRREAGRLLARLQEGESLPMPTSRPMPSIGKGCHELRVRDGEHNWRIFYRIDSEFIMIVEVCPKKTAKTPKPVIELCQNRLATFDKAKKGK